MTDFLDAVNNAEELEKTEKLVLLLTSKPTRYPTDTAVTDLKGRGK